MDRKRVVYYDFARVFAIISISFNHAVNRTFDNYTDTQAEFLSLDHQTILIKTCVTVFSRLGVPIFLMLTGALILSKSFETKDDLKRFYTHNWLRILITTELWLAIYYWFYYYLCPETYLLDLTHDELIHRFITTLLFVNQATEGLMWYMNMLIPLYTLLPVFAVFVSKKGFGRYLILPSFFTLFVTVIVYDVNRNLAITNPDPEALIVTNLYAPLTYFAVYVLAGYAISKGVLRKFPAIFILLLAGEFFALAVRYQLWFYEGPTNDLVSYDSVPLMLCAMTLFEFFRRLDGKVMAFFKGILSHISRRCFGIYFLHIIIMELLCWHYDLSAFTQVQTMLIIQAVSVVGALLIIEILSIIPPFRKYLFMVK